MKLTRRQAVKGLGAAGLTAGASSFLGAPAIAQNTPLKIGILAPKAGIAGTVGECGLRGTQWAVERINKAGGIAGRKVELVVEEETNPQQTIERFNKLVLQDKVDCIQGVVSTGVSLALGPVVEDNKALTIFWDGTTQDGVNEKLPNAKFCFKSTDNECEAVMASLLAVKHFKGKFATIAGINPDYSYGRNNWAAFQAILQRFGIEFKVVAEQWPKVGNMELTSHVTALKAAKPDLIFSSMLFADLPVFMQQAHAAELTKDTKMVFPAAGWQHTRLKKEFTPENMIFGHNTLYFNHPKPSPLQKEFVDWYVSSFKDYPHWEADRAYFSMEAYRVAVEAAHKNKGSWPSQDEVAEALRSGIKVTSLGGPGTFRKDNIAEQTFYQGLSTHKNEVDFVTLGEFDSYYSDVLQKPAGANFWEWLKTAKFPV